MRACTGAGRCFGRPVGMLRGTLRLILRQWYGVLRCPVQDQPLDLPLRSIDAQGLDPRQRRKGRVRLGLIPEGHQRTAPRRAGLCRRVQRVVISKSRDTPIPRACLFLITMQAMEDGRPGTGCLVNQLRL